MHHDGVCTPYQKEYIDRDSKVVVVAGSLLGLPSSTNLIHYITAEDIIESDEARERFTRAYSLSDI
ncbi:MAG: hypothetical protein ACXAD7_13730 [Candidatus Kariarchaeaceae archaeon]|jgi:hypothetical protein